MTDQNSETGKRSTVKHLVMPDTIVCKKDFLMENGPVAFLAGKAYRWRWTTEEEQDDTRCFVAANSEIGPNHFLTITDVFEYFEA